MIEHCNCEECPLKGSVTVPGEGTNGTASLYEVALVGIAPAKAEVSSRRPLVGWSGQLLRKTLAKLGVNDFYLTNTLLCQLPENVKDSEKSRAFECCTPRLLKEIEDVNPSVVIAMGNVPLEALTGVAYKIRSVQGRVLPGLVKPVLPVIHPASLRHRSEEFYDFVDGLRVAPKFLDGTYQQACIPNKTIVTDEDSLVATLEAIDKAELVAVDIETTSKGFYPYGADPDKVRCLCIATDERNAFIIPGESSPHFEPHPNFVPDQRIKDLLARKKCVFHNGPFDIGFLMQEGYRLKIHFDTFLGHYLTDERQYSHGLKALASKYLGAPDWEEDIKLYLPHKVSSYDLIPDEALYKYAAFDVVYTYQLSEGLGLRRKVADTFPYKNILNPCANAFAEIRHKGMAIDVGYLMELDEVLDREMTIKRDELSETVGRELNPFSSQDVASLLYDTLGYPEQAGFGRSTSAKVLRLHGGEICNKILEVREFGKLRSTYVIGVANFIDKDFRIHPFIKLHGTVTGRLAASDPSIMNVSYDGGVRKLYIADKGRQLLELDQKQMELRCYIIEAKDDYLRSLLEAGIDTHGLVQQRLIEKSPYSDKWSGHEGRKRAKTGVFGRLYGRGIRDFMLSFGLTEAEATDFLKTIDELFPSVPAYLVRVKKEVHATGVLTSRFGRKRRFGLVLDENKHEAYRQASNFYIQSMASDINLLGMLHLWDMRHKWDIFPLFPVHDSILIDVPDESVVPEIKKELEEYSQSLINGEMDFKVECAIGPNWGDMRKLEFKE